MLPDQLQRTKRAAVRHQTNRISRSMLFTFVCLMASSMATLVLMALLAAIAIQGTTHLSWNFLQNPHIENRPEVSGIAQAIVGSVVVCGVCALLALPIGVATAIYLEEFQPKNVWLRRMQGLVSLNLMNLAGVPSVVYGILGVTAFVYMFGLFDPIRVNQKPVFEIGTKYFYQVETAVSVKKRLASTPEAADRSLADPFIGQFFSFALEDSDHLTVSISQSRAVTDTAGLPTNLTVIADLQELSKNDILKSTTHSETEITEIEDSKIQQPEVVILAGSVASRYPQYAWYHWKIPFGRGVLAAGLTLGLVMLPMVIIVSQEAIRAVPQSYRLGSLALGADRWQTIYGVTLPTAMPGILTGAILTISRAVGEAAPIIAVMGGILGTSRGLSHLMDGAPVIPVTIYRWSLHQNAEYDNLAAAAIIILISLLIVMNSIAFWIRYRFERSRGVL